MLSSGLLVGYIGHSEIRYVLGTLLLPSTGLVLVSLISFIEKYRRIGSIDNDTLCVFHKTASSGTSGPSSSDDPSLWPGSPNTPSRLGRDALIGVADEDIEMLDAAPSEELSFESYVNMVSALPILYPHWGVFKTWLCRLR